MKVSFTVPGAPKGKGRPRFVKIGNYTKAYTPQETDAYENLVKMAYRTQVGTYMLQGAIKMEVLAFFPIPQSASKKKRGMMASGLIPCTTKPDADNILKCLCDGGNNVIFNDDKQITEVSIKKLYGEVPRVEVILTELERDGERYDLSGGS